MANKNFNVEHVSGAYGNSQEIPWHKASVEGPFTFVEARNNLAKYKAEMRARCGAAGWDSHTRIVAIEDQPMTSRFTCYGPTGPSGYFCPESKNELVNYTWPESKIELVNYTWPAGETNPGAPLPANFSEANLCNDCAKKELEAQQKEIEAQQKEIEEMNQRMMA